MLFLLLSSSSSLLSLLSSSAFYYYYYYHYYHYHYYYHYHHHYYYYYYYHYCYYYYCHYSVNNIPYQCDITCAGHFTLDALASRTVACHIYVFDLSPSRRNTCREHHRKYAHCSHFIALRSKLLYSVSSTGSWKCLIPVTYRFITLLFSWVINLSKHVKSYCG